MQAAFQQLMQSPNQVQRLMQLLSSSNSANGPTPILTGPSQSGSWTPPAALDLPQLTQLALYDNSTGGGGNNGLTFDSNNDTVGPSAAQLAEDEARLALTYQDVNEVDADVDGLQVNINTLIENMGFDSAPLPTTTIPPVTSVPQPPLPLSEGGMPPPDTSADFDFESFLTAFTDAQDSEVGATDVDIDAVVGDRISLVPRSTVSGSGSAMGMETDSVKEPMVQPALGGIGRKRTSDVAELGPPLPEPPKSILSSHDVAATRADASAGDPPRAKRNKK
jgi:hypothetical protein